MRASVAQRRWPGRCLAAEWRRSRRDGGRALPGGL